METISFEIRFSPLLKINKGHTCLLNLALYFSLLTLSGCVTSQNSSPLAPSPPVIDSASLMQQQEQLAYQPLYFANPNMTDVDMGAIHGSATPLGNEEVQLNAEGVVSVKGLKDVSTSLKECRLKDRFDRKALIAYEWDRSRVSLDVDGLNFDGGGERAVWIGYKMRFQPEKTRKERCRYPSSWQGLVGSGYNEFFVREDDTVWKEFKGLKEDAVQYIDRVF